MTTILVVFVTTDLLYSILIHRWGWVIYIFIYSRFDFNYKCWIAVDSREEYGWNTKKKGISKFSAVYAN